MSYISSPHTLHACALSRLNFSQLMSELCNILLNTNNSFTLNVSIMPWFCFKISTPRCSLFTSYALRLPEGNASETWWYVLQHSSFADRFGLYSSQWKISGLHRIFLFMRFVVEEFRSVGYK